jgi:DNA-binding transcriptional LysR family regulator
VTAGLAVAVLPESAVRPGMRVLGQADGFPPLPTARIGLIRNAAEASALVDALANHIVQSLDNLPNLKPAIAAE